MLLSGLQRPPQDRRALRNRYMRYTPPTPIRFDKHAVVEEQPDDVKMETSTIKEETVDEDVWNENGEADFSLKTREEEATEKGRSLEDEDAVGA